MRLFAIFIFFSTLNFANLNSANDSNIEALPNVLFSYEKLKKEHNATTLQVDFNKAVSYLEEEKYKKAIDIFEKTSKALKIPSFLNIGIAYYRLKDNQNAQKYLKIVFDNKEIMHSHTYSYMSSSYYLHKITNNPAYLYEVIEVAKTLKRNLNDNEKRILADSFIMLKDYNNALKILDLISSGVELKKAIIYLKQKEYEKAEIFLERAKTNSLNENELDVIYWLMMYRDLKSNNISKIRQRIDELGKRSLNFNVNRILPLKVIYNKYKCTPKEYLKSVKDYSLDRQIDMVFYFAPFIFSDKQEIIYDSTKGFIFNSSKNSQNLDEMIKYNEQFITIIKKDPLERVKELQDLLNKKEDSKSYVYYNLALSLAQIQDFSNAYKYFSKAFKLNPGNKLYGVMTLISAKRVNIKSDYTEYIQRNIFSEYGMYNYFGQSLYELFINEVKSTRNIQKEYEGAILSSAIDVFKKLKFKQELNGYEELFTKYYKDPLVYLMKQTIREPKENEFNYISRLQDTIPLSFNSQFLDISLVVTEFYIDILKGLGLLDRVSFSSVGTNYSPSYLRSFAIKLIYANQGDAAISILEYLQNTYNLKDRYTLYLIVAAYLSQNEYNQAMLQISLIRALINDADANFLNGVEMIEAMKINSAKQYFEHPYSNRLIDFDLFGLDKYLESL